MIKKISYFLVVFFLFTLFVNKNIAYANKENKLGLYGITFDSTLNDIVDIAKAKKFEFSVCESCIDQKLEEFFKNSQLDIKNISLLDLIRTKVFHSSANEFCAPGVDCKKVDEAMECFFNLTNANRLRKYTIFPIVLERREEVNNSIQKNEITIAMIYDKNEQTFKVAYFSLYNNGDNSIVSRAIDILEERFGPSISKNVPYMNYNYWEIGDDVAITLNKEMLYFYRKKVLKEFLDMSFSEFEYAINEDKNEKIKKEKEEKERYRRDM